MNKEFVKFDKVDKSYDGKTLVVKDLQLDIEEGEFVTMLGPSGSGKTTCLMMLAGFETPTHGEIYLDGKAISSIPPHKRGIGMVFQNYALFPHMTVYENLAFPLRVRKIPKDEADKKIDKALSMVSLQGFASRMPGQLSGGQQQRVAVARSLVFDPQLVLMDEPLGALDKNLRESMQYEIKHIHESIGVTVVYVTHDQSEALTMSNRIAVFNDGKDHWQYIEKGRPANQTPPPYARILEWCVAKGIPREAAWAIRANIAKFGSPRKKGSKSIDQSKLGVVRDTMKAVEPFILKELDKQAEASFEATIGKQWQSL